MSETSEGTAAREDSGAPGSDSTTTPPDATSSVNRGALVILALIVVTLAWYLMADRFTPYTSQARVQGYVVGVAPKVAGLVTAVEVRNNERVKAGQPLFTIDRSQYEIALQKANSDLDNARQQVAAGDAGVTKAEANLVAALAGQRKAEQDFTRLKRLRSDDPGTISERRLEVSEANLEQARANVAAARAQIQAAIEQKGGADEANNTLLQTARTGVEKAQLDLDNTNVVAQSAGIITDLRAEVGQFAGTGSPVLTLVAMEEIWINAEYTENNLGHLKPGTAVEILLDALPGAVLKGKVANVGIGVSAGNSPPPGALPSIQNSRDWLRQAQRFPVQVEFEKPVSAEVLQQLRVGGQASVIAYSEGHPILGLLGRLYIRLLSIVSYAY
ncbi:HlyD family secretion protein [Parahaliea maris]|uniref:HlyD family secretion protein n=1 Tax=Parahaliea maris TaxID=2716870 RepID=A0A5C8ZRP0_9GAMM|nr:HlyD family secretion protein [Parahaliea maris]TXS90177.1 HlyD family secretion protein [Parahaliea maris]